MIRNVALFKLSHDANPSEIAILHDCLRALNPPGCLSFTLGDDLGLRSDGWDFAIVADFVDEAAYRAYDIETEHNRIRARLAPHIDQAARIQYRLDGPEGGAGSADEFS